MDWIKIKTGHILNTGLTLIQIGALVKMQALTAHLERIPSEKELNREVAEKARRGLAEVLQSQRTSPAEVLQKVCEDCARVMEQRHTSSARIKKWRSDQEKQAMLHVTGSKQIDKIDKKEREIGVSLTRKGKNTGNSSRKAIKKCYEILGKKKGKKK